MIAPKLGRSSIQIMVPLWLWGLAPPWSLAAGEDLLDVLVIAAQVRKFKLVGD